MTELENLLVARTTLVRLADLVDSEVSAIINAIRQKSEALCNDLAIASEPEPLAYQFQYQFACALKPFEPAVLELLSSAEVANPRTARCRQELRRCLKRLNQLDQECLAISIELQDRRLGSWSTGATLLEKAYSDWRWWLCELRDLICIAQESLSGIATESAKT